MKYVNLHCHSDGSLLDGLSSPEQIVDRSLELGYDSAALTDHGNISNAINFYKICKKKNIKPLLGCELYLCDKLSSIKDKDNKNKHHLVVIAKNLDGWKSLIKLVSASNQNFYYKPRLSLEELRPFAGNLIAFSGHLGSQLSNVCTENEKVLDDAKYKAADMAAIYQDIFGKENFFLEIQRITGEAAPLTYIVSDVLRDVGRALGIKTIATADSHYPTRRDAEDQKVLMCTSLKIKMKFAKSGGTSFGFFNHNCFHIPSIDELTRLHTEEEINNTQLVADMCENYNILASKPDLPKFDVPNGKTEIEYLRELAREGWRSKLANRLEKNKHQSYGDRVKEELGVFEEAGLSGYFLIVKDILDWARSQDILVGPGRGSVGGSLAAYLLNITDVDPIQYKLLFSRFYNKGRNTKDRVAMPDIDCDFQKARREDVIGYIRNKYGHDKVSQICTFGKLKGRSALKDVLSVYEACSFDEMNEITYSVPDEAKINDELQKMEEEDGESSIIKWALENESKALSKWCSINDKGVFEGEYADFFKQAIRLEGKKRSQGKHASGIIISNKVLGDVCPMIHDERGADPITGFDMNDLEAIGQVKFDILGVAILDKVQHCVSQIRNYLK